MRKWDAERAPGVCDGAEGLKANFIVLKYADFNITNNNIKTPIKRIQYLLDKK